MIEGARGGGGGGRGWADGRAQASNRPREGGGGLEHLVTEGN